MDLYLEPFRKFAVFSGRARRAEYWVFALVNILIGIVLTFVDATVGFIDTDTGLGAFGIVFNLIILVPSIAVLVRRLHDTGRSAWWLLVGLVPLIGAIVLLIFALLGSEEGDNQYGAQPLAGS